MSNSSITPKPTEGIIALAKKYEELSAKPVIMNRYMPDTTLLQSSGIGFLTQPKFTQDNIFSRFTMLPGTHTAETCAMNAGLISANQQYDYNADILSHNISVNDGFFLEVYSGYFWDDITFFDNNSPVYHSYSNASSPVFSTGYANISDITWQYLGEHNNKASSWSLYSIRLTGIFIFDVVGTWTFVTTSDDSSVLWIGDTAITGTTTSNIDLNNNGGHGMRTVVFQYKCTEVGEQPIRIMQGNWGGPSGLIFQYKSPGWNSYSNTCKYNGKTYIKNYTKNGKPIHNNVYYALFGDAKTNKIQCGIYGQLPANPETRGYSVEQGFLQSSVQSMDNTFILDNTGDYTEVVAWEIVDPKSNIFGPASKIYLSLPGILNMDTPNGTIPISFTENNIYIGAKLNFNSPYALTNKSNPNRIAEAQQYAANYSDLRYYDPNSAAGHYESYGINEGRQYSNTFSATINNDGNFYVKDGKGNVIWSLTEVAGSSDTYTKTQGNIRRLSQDTFKKIVKDAVVNPKWVKLSQSGVSDTLSMGQIMTNGYNNNKGIQFIVDKGGRFKIQVSDKGNLVLVITKKIKPSTFTESGNTYNYTSFDDKSAYLYKIKAPPVLAKTFVTETDKNGLNPAYHKVDTKSEFLSYSNTTGGSMNYTEYKTYYPPSSDVNKDSQMSKKECESACNANKDCMYYYSYTNNSTGSSKEYCQLSGPKDHITFAASSDPKNQSSTLFVKNPDVLFNALLSDPYNKTNALLNTVGVPKNHPISNIPFDQNNQDQITDSKYYSYLTDLQGTLHGGSGGIVNGGVAGATKNPPDVAGTMTSKDSSTAAAAGAAAVAAASSVAVSSTNQKPTQPPPSTSNTIGQVGFTTRESFRSRESFKEGINSTDDLKHSTEKENYLPISTDSIPSTGNNIGTITPIGTRSTLEENPTDGYSNPNPSEMLTKDLAFHLFPNNGSAAIGNYSSKGGLKIVTDPTLNTTASHALFANNDHPASCFAWDWATNTNRDDIKNDKFGAKYVVLPDGYTPPGPNSYSGNHPLGVTFAFWMCGSYSKTYSRIFDFGDEFNWGSNGNHQMIVAFIDQYLVFVIDNYPNTQTWAWVGMNINFNDWHHVVWTISTDGKWKIYVNGAQVGSPVMYASMGWNKTTTDRNISGGGATYPDPTYKLNRCFIGQSNWWWDPYFNGGLSDFRVYNGLLSEQEIGYLYNRSYDKYNTNLAQRSINRGIHILCHFNLQTVWHWRGYAHGYGISRNADGSSGDFGWDKLQIYYKNDHIHWSSQDLIKKDTSISYGYCLKLDGNSFAIIGDNYYRQNPMRLPPPSGGMTISVWIKADPNSNNSPSSCCPNQWRRIIDFGNGPGQDNIVLALWEDSLAFWVMNEKGVVSSIGPTWSDSGWQNGSQAPTSIKIADSKWHHIVWSIAPASESGKYKWCIYIDNKYYPLSNFSSSYSTNTLRNCYVGKSNWGCEGLLVGSICDFRIYSKVFLPKNGNTVPDEISLLYKKGSMDSLSSNESFTNKSVEGFSLLGGNPLLTNYREGYTTPPVTHTQPVSKPASNPSFVNYGSSSTNVDFSLDQLYDNTYSLYSTATNYNKKFNRVYSNYADISANIDLIIGISNELIDSDYNNVETDILNHFPSTSAKDVLKNDVQELILQENKIYSIGVITCATLLISALLISSKR